MPDIDPKVQEALTLQQQLESDRAVWDQHWREVAERILPRQNDFQQTHRPGGEKRTEKIFDSTAPLALDRGASAIDSLITPATQQWHALEPEDEKLRENREVMIYLAEVTKILHRFRYRPSANFASQAHECYVGLLAFGTTGMFTDDEQGFGLRYKSLSLNQLYIMENHVGIVDLVHRKFPLTARAAHQKWGDALPEGVRMAAERTPARKYDFLHCVKPNENPVHRARNYKGMPWSSYYIALEGKKLLSEGGYRSMPYAISRHVTAPEETYGRSPAMLALADIKMLNEMEKTTLRAAHKIVDPPLLAFGDGVLNAFSTRPNAINYGGVNDQGQQLIHPMKTGANIPIVLEMTEQKRKAINDAFFITLFQILVQNPQMTATEALIRAQEKGQLLAPTVGRQQSEFLGPIIERELDVLAMMGVLPPMPDALQRSGGSVRAIYTSPLSRLRRAEDGVAIARTIEILTPISQAKPDVWDIFDDAELAYEIADINGVPLKVLRSREDLQAKREQDAQNQQAMADSKNAEAAAGAAKNLGQAAQAAGSVQLPQLPGQGA